MNKKLASIFGVITVAVLVASTASAQGIPGTGWWTGEQVQNVGTGTATINVTAYDKNSSSTYQANSSLAAGASVNFNPSAFTGMPSGFIGSAVVSSDQPIKAVVNVTNQQSGSFGVAGGRAAAGYQGTESTATTLYFPMAKNNRFTKTTAFYIQNAGSADTTVRAVFKMDNGGVYTFTTGTVNPNKMVVILPSDAGVPSSPSDGTRVNIGSVSVTSVASQPLAGTVLEYTQAESPAQTLKGTRGFTSADFAVKAYAPIVKKARFGRFTGIQVLNVSASPINVTIDYVGTSSNCAGVTTQDTLTGIAAGASRTQNQDSTSNFTNNCTAAATITADGNFVAIVNEDNLAGFALAGITYSAFPASNATAKVSAPLFKDRRFGLTSGMQVMNVGTVAATNVVATFACKGADATNTPFTAVTIPLTIAAGGGKLFYKPSTTPADFADLFDMDGANCGVTITSDQPIVTIVNETPDPAGVRGTGVLVNLDDNNYEAFNLTP